jgi:hypothetical protein
MGPCGRVLLDGGASVADLVALLTAGGGAVFDDRWGER